MNGWVAALIAALIVGVLGLSVGLFALYQKNKEMKEQQK